jgi:hypothetical protein
MTNEILVRTKAKIESAKLKLKEINLPITTTDYSEGVAGFATESVL